ncbi:hypothetical protein LCI18_014748 [Fusarium solani-melongenae]|uniref:Uncharacterized protein n=1 Tax=Fusarium solani subsp. cucurbitae TaxID=2747967 RepID=A0ACD3ZRU9_FUSSC|nr:hypothetical protein LCI18_014748 [Fusarium solani-melongenae]
MEKTLTRKNGRVWSDSNRLQLLAYLNWCATYRESFLLTAEDHLKRVTGNDFTQTQICRKLRFEWEKHGLCDNFDDIFTQGTPSLGLSDEEQSEIQSIFTGLLHGLHGLRSNTRETRTRTRVPLNTAGTFAAKRPAIRLKVTNKNSRIRSGASLYPVDYSVNDEGDEDNAVNSVDVLHAESEVSELSSLCPSLQSAPHSPSLTSSPGPTEQPPDDISALQDEVLKLKGHNLTLRNRVSELETEHEKMRDLRRSSKRDVNYCNQMVSFLEKRKAMSTHSGNVKHSKARRPGLPESTIMQEHRDLYLEILNEAQAFSGGDESPKISNNNQNAHPARGWAMKASGWDLHPLLCHYMSEKIPSSRLVAALVAAGIFDLVFERAFPDVLGVESPLTDGYRRHILAKDGHEALHMADLTALESLTQRDIDGKDRIKEQMIEEKAEHLSEFMLQNLSFCITAKSQDMTPDGDTVMQEPPDLDNSLRKALSLKFSLTTSMKRLKFYFFLPGHEFDETSMEKDDMSSDGCVVKLCLLPALFSVPRNKLDTKIEESRWEVETRYDRCLTEAMEEEVASLRLVAKAVVLT